MEFFDTDVWMPIDRHEFEITTETPRIPTAFEWAAANIVAKFRNAPQYSAASISDVFRTALGGDGSEMFLRSALDELFSATTNVLTTDNHDVSPERLPISSVKLTEDGERMIETGALPSEPKRERRTVVFDPVSRRLVANDMDGQGLPDGAVSLEGAAGDPVPPVEEVRAQAEKNVKEGCRIGRVEAMGQGRREWRRQRVGFTLEGGQVKLNRKAFGLSSEMADFLEALSPERARSTFFGRAFDAGESFPKEVSPLPDDCISVTAPAVSANGTPRFSKLVLRNGEDRGGFAASALEIVSGDGVGISWTPEGPAKLTLPAADFPLPAGTTSDGKRMIRNHRIRCFYAGHPIELPVVVETAVNEDECKRIVRKVESIVDGLNACDRIRVKFMLAENHEDRKNAVAGMVAQTAGDERLSALKALIEDLHARTSYVDMHAVVDGIFGMPGLAGFASVDEAQALADALPFTDDELRWVKGALRKYRDGQVKVGEKAENEFVWIEKSSKGFPHGGGKHHGKNRNKHKKGR